jgi:hypothetical protein
LSIKRKLRQGIDKARGRSGSICRYLDEDKFPVDLSDQTGDGDRIDQILALYNMVSKPWHIMKRASFGSFRKQEMNNNVNTVGCRDLKGRHLQLELSRAEDAR